MANRFACGLGENLCSPALLVDLHARHRLPPTCLPRSGLRDPPDHPLGPPCSQRAPLKHAYLTSWAAPSAQHALTEPSHTWYSAGRPESRSSHATLQQHTACRGWGPATQHRGSKFLSTACDTLLNPPKDAPRYPCIISSFSVVWSSKDHLKLFNTDHHEKSTDLLKDSPTVGHRHCLLIVDAVNNTDLNIFMWSAFLIVNDPLSSEKFPEWDSPVTG